MGIYDLRIGDVNYFVEHRRLKPKRLITLIFNSRQINATGGRKEESCCPSERVSLAIFAFVGVNIAIAQTQNAPGAVPLSPSQEFRFISTTKTSTFEKELNDWAAKGFRFARLAKAFNDLGIGGLLAREKEGEGGKYEYKALATNKLSTMKKELEAGAAEGFEFRGITTEEKFMPFTYPETIVIMERPVGESKRRFDYKFVPAAPFFLLMKGKEVTIPKGTLVTSFIDGDHRLDREAFVRANEKRP